MPSSFSRCQFLCLFLAFGEYYVNIMYNCNGGERRWKMRNSIDVQHSTARAWSVVSEERGEFSLASAICFSFFFSLFLKGISCLNFDYGGVPLGPP